MTAANFFLWSEIESSTDAILYVEWRGNIDVNDSAISRGRNKNLTLQMVSDTKNESLNLIDKRCYYF